MVVAVIEDSDLRDVLVHWLTAHHHDVRARGAVDQDLIDPHWWTGVDVAVIDIDLPSELGGIDLARWLKVHAEHVRRVLTTGHIWQATHPEAREVADVILDKPYPLERLTEALIG